MNDYLKEKPYTQHQEYQKRFSEIDTIISDLSKLSCIDSGYYLPGSVMKSNPPMTDVVLYKEDSSDTLWYIMRIKFDEPMKVVFIGRWYK